MHDISVEGQTEGVKIPMFLMNARFQKKMREMTCVILQLELVPITDPSRDTSDRGSGHRTSSRRA